MRLLYVEDNRINALLFEETLKLRGGFDLRVAEDGAQALSLAAEWRPDVLVLDSHLPDLSGTQVLQRLRALPGFDAVPAFMCSADVLPEDVQQAMAAGFKGYWPKPIDIEQVLQDLAALQA
jgi:CheY-like chemotaxis protein